MWSNQLVCIKSSPIDGYGVFAKKQIPKGTPIAYFWGIEMTPKDIKLKYGNYRNCLRRPFHKKWICSRVCPHLINFVNGVGFGKSINMQPNCEIKKRWLMPTRDIKPGEELLLEYPKGYFKDLRLK